MNRILIAGGGASGMMAAIIAARRGARVDLIEQNERLGKKLFITGKGRCNLTNNCSHEELMEAVVTNAHFLYGTFSRFDNFSAIRFFEELGVPTKVERGGRVFPKSDHSSDIIRAMTKEMKNLGVRIHLNSKVSGLLLVQGEGAEKGLKVRGVVLENGQKLPADAVIVSSGGLTYPSTGSTDDGYSFARAAGHTILPCRPALVPLITREAYIQELQGLSLKNVILRVWKGKKKLYEKFGELLFTHYGISGPLALNASSYIAKALEKGELRAEIDLKSALSEEQLDRRLLRELTEHHAQSFRNAIGSLFPSKLRPVAVKLSGISPEKTARDITKEERKAFGYLIKHFPLTIVKTADYDQSIVTQGGISVREIDPKTMESKKASGLFFTGEVLDLDAITGGFNLTIAWSTGYTAAMAATGRHSPEDEM